MLNIKEARDMGLQEHILGEAIFKRGKCVNVSAKRYAPVSPSAVTLPGTVEHDDSVCDSAREGAHGFTPSPSQQSALQDCMASFGELLKRVDRVCADATKAPSMAKVQATTEVVINACYGGFSLSEAGVKFMRSNGYPDASEHMIVARHDEALVNCIKTLGAEAAGGRCAALEVAVIKGSKYKIHEYDGLESVITPYDDDYTTAVQPSGLVSTQTKPKTQPVTKTCKYFLRAGGCRLGSKCKFMHPVKPEVAVPASGKVVIPGPVDMQRSGYCTTSLDNTLLQSKLPVGSVHPDFKSRIDAHQRAASERPNGPHNMPWLSQSESGDIVVVVPEVVPDLKDDYDNYADHEHRMTACGIDQPESDAPPSDGEDDDRVPEYDAKLDTSCPSPASTSKSFESISGKYGQPAPPKDHLQMDIDALMREEGHGPPQLAPERAEEKRVVQVAPLSGCMLLDLCNVINNMGHRAAPSAHGSLRIMHSHDEKQVYYIWVRKGKMIATTVKVRKTSQHTSLDQLTDEQREHLVVNLAAPDKLALPPWVGDVMECVIRSLQVRATQ